jgi:long-chain acyl-CoA synthetase
MSRSWDLSDRSDVFEARATSQWGAEVERSGWGGHAGIVYRTRPPEILAMLADARRWRDRTYLVQGSKRIAVDQFLTGIEHAAAVLYERGVRAGDHVAVLAYNCPEFALAVWSVWRIGAVPVLCNRWWSAAEIDHAMDLVKPVLTLNDLPDQALLGDFDGIGLADLAVAWDDAELTTSVPVPNLSEDAPALMLFTSGTTGVPKAVALSQRAVVANQHNLLLRSGRLPHQLDPDAPQPVTLVCTPLFHIGGVSNIVTQLLIGGRLVLTEGKFDAGQVLRLIETERVQNWGGVPTMASRVLEHPDFDNTDMSSLRSFPLGGAPLPASLLDRMRQKLPQLERRGLANTWGMTESGGFLTVAGNRDLVERPGTVGRPYPVVELRIESPDGDGVGEILVRSPTVMIGYYGVDDETVDSDGWLHTGDLGRLDGDGYLFLEGRSKDIVIRGGENIACAHVEHCLLTHPDVVEAAAFGVPHPDLGEELAAAVVVRPGAHLDEALLREYLRKHLAYFEVPSMWQLRTEPMPTLAGEKIDKRALRTELTSGA